MILSTRVRRCFLALHKVDFRSGHDGLTGQLYQMGLDPFAGDLVIFIGRHKSRLKAIYADTSGLWVATKRFEIEAMKTKVRFLSDPRCREITQAELAMILEGAAYAVEQRVADFVREESPKND